MAGNSKDKRQIGIIGYPTNLASSGGDSPDTPQQYKEIVFPHLKGKYGVTEEFNIVEVNTTPSKAKNKINNYDSLKTSLENLFTQQCKTMWAGEVPLTIGGDHSQGFPTVKSALFMTVLKDIVSDESKFLESSAKDELKEYANNGQFLKAAKRLDDILDGRTEILNHVIKLVNKIDVVWVDAHGDFNTKNTSDSGNLHGMSLAAACGLNTGGLQNIGGRHIFANPKNVHIMCARDLDKKEERLMKKAGVDFERFEMHNPKRGKIRPQGQARSSETKDFNTVFKQLVKDIKAKGHKIILSTDIDHLIVEETGTCVGSKKNVRINRHGESPPGPPPADTYKAYAKIAHDKTFIAFDLTEVALSYLNALTNKREAGSKAFRAGTNIIASLVGGDEARLDVLTAMKSNNGNLTKKFTARLIGEAGVAPNNGKGSTSF